MKFSVIYKPTTLFSLKDSNSTNSGAKSLFLPSPYAIKMALLNQAITIGGDIQKLEAEKSKEFAYIRDAKIGFNLSEGSNFVVNNSFVKILKIKEDKRNKKDKESGVPFVQGFQQTISFREYVFISHPLEIIFDVKNEDAKTYLKRYLHKINYFGKRGCFFQFIEYSDVPNEVNVKPFNVLNGVAGMLQEYDDFDEKATFDNANNFSSAKSNRKKQILVLPLKGTSSSKSFTHYKVF